MIEHFGAPFGVAGIAVKFFGAVEAIVGVGRLLRARVEDAEMQVSGGVMRVVIGRVQITLDGLRRVVRFLISATEIDISLRLIGLQLGDLLISIDGALRVARERRANAFEVERVKVR